MIRLRKHLCPFLLAALACDDTPPASAPVSVPSPLIPSVSVGPTGRTLAVGDSLLFTATTNISGTTGFVWAVSSTTSASVSVVGWVRALSPGPVAVIACVVPDKAACGNATLTIQ